MVSQFVCLCDTRKRNHRGKFVSYLLRQDVYLSNLSAEIDVDTVHCTLHTRNFRFSSHKTNVCTLNLAARVWTAGPMYPYLFVRGTKYCQRPLSEVNEREG